MFVCDFTERNKSQPDHHNLDQTKLDFNNNNPNQTDPTQAKPDQNWSK